MAMIAISGYASRMVDVDDSVAVGLLDMGFSELEIREADTVHVSHISVEDNAPTLHYWYTASVPPGGGQPVVKTPLSEATSSDNQPEGHPIFPGGERMIRGVRNIRNFRIIAGTGTVRMAVTIGTFGRTPIN